MAHTLTFDTSYMTVTVNGSSVSSPYTLNDGDVILLDGNTDYKGYKAGSIYVNGSPYHTVETIAINNEDISATCGGTYREPDPTWWPEVTINYSESSGYTITYSTPHGTTPSSVSSITTLTSAELPTLTETGYTFNGWYYESSYTTQAAVGDTISADTTLYAKWTQNGYTVSYSTEHGTAPSAATHIETLSATELPTLTEAHYTFGGWFYESSFTTQAAIGDTVSQDITLYAKWTALLVNKVMINGTTKLDLTSDTVTAAHLESGYTAHTASGAVVTGTLSYSSQAKSATPSTSAQTITPDTGYDGLSSVSVSAATLQTKTATPSTSSQSITADSGYYGLETVTVSAIAEQSKTLTLGASAPSTVTPDSGYELSSVVPSIDTSVIKAENIAQGTTILGVTGTHSGGGSSTHKILLLNNGIGNTVFISYNGVVYYTSGDEITVADGDSVNLYSISSTVYLDGVSQSTTSTFTPTEDVTVLIEVEYISSLYGYEGIFRFATLGYRYLQNKTVIENGTVTANTYYDGLGTVTVNTPTVGNVTVEATYYATTVYSTDGTTISIAAGDSEDVPMGSLCYCSSITSASSRQWLDASTSVTATARSDGWVAAYTDLKQGRYEPQP